MSVQIRQTTYLKRLIANEHGAEVVEFVGLFPLVLLTLAIAWQLAVAGYAGLLASGAAREAARAAATRENVDRAVRNASPGFDGRRQWSALAGYPCASNNPVTIEVKLQVPHLILPLLGALDAYPWTTARATARCEPPPR
ncbi:MAG: pilus assembly protein [Roseiflexaceae bacterium]|nr:pilus assembly protein [Roseiflexaceae bacterium]